MNSVSTTTIKTHSREEQSLDQYLQEIGITSWKDLEEYGISEYQGKSKK